MQLLKSRPKLTLVFLVAVFGCLMAVSASAAIRNVPSIDYPTIQAAINAANNGDTVLVANGTYTGPGNRNIDFLGKAITVESENGSTNCTIDCQGSGRGFIFQNSEGAASVLSGFTITNGTANDGGAIYCNLASPTISNCNFLGNTASFYGGAISCENSSSPEITSCTFNNNSANFGGAIACESSSAPTISDCNLDTNTADYYGGGIYLYSASPEITECTLNANTAETYGGGLYCGGSSSPNISDCTISNNVVTSTAFGRGGGGVYSTDSSPSISNSTINNNTAANSGGGVYGDDSPLTLINCIVDMNTATNNRGGGIYFFFNTPTIGGCTISNNTAYDGGGIYCDSSSPNVYTTTISGNTADRYGGGLYGNLSYASFATCLIDGNDAEFGGGMRISEELIEGTISVANSIIANNTADYGAGIDILHSSPIFTNNTVTKNTANFEGGGLRYYSTSRRPEFINTIFWDNNRAGSPQTPDEIWVVSGAILFEYCNIRGGYPGTGNTDGDPMFKDAANNDFHLTAGSAGIDAATSLGAPTVDYDGTPRWDDPNTPNEGGGTDDYYDIGAYEYYPACEYDMDFDNDIDGIDLALLADGYDPLNDDLAIFAEDFGRTDCPEF